MNRNEHISNNISSYKYIETLYNNAIHTLQNGNYNGEILHITVVVAIFLLFYYGKTLILINNKNDPI